MASPKHIIYGLVDPRTLLVRYVGKSSSGMTRPREHRRDPVRWATHVARWVASLQALDLQFRIVVLEPCDATTLSAAECWWIAYGRASNWPLTNLTDGGDGVPGFKKSEETKLKISKAQRGRIKTAEECANIAAGLRGLKRSTASIEKQRRTITGRKASDAHRAAISTALKGKRKSPEHVAKMRASMRGRGRDWHGRVVS